MDVTNLQQDYYINCLEYAGHTSQDIDGGNVGNPLQAKWFLFVGANTAALFDHCIVHNVSAEKLISIYDPSGPYPNASDVQVLPENPTLGDDLICDFNFVNPVDKLIEKGSTYEWWRNGTNQNINYQILGRGNLSLDEGWYCKVTPSDGRSNGTQVQSVNTVTVASVVKDVKFYVDSNMDWNESGYVSGRRKIVSFEDKLNNALDSCSPYDDGYCNITLDISSDTSGKINLSNLRVYYTPEEGNLSVHNISINYSFYGTRVFNFSIQNNGSTPVYGISWSFELGDGTINTSTQYFSLQPDETKNFSLNHTYALEGIYTVRVNVTSYGLFDSEEFNETIDATINKPIIESLSATNPQGFGEDVTITANIIEGPYETDTVLVGITPPELLETNYSMWSIAPQIWVLDNFTSYLNGTHDFTVYVNDSIGNESSDSSSFDIYSNIFGYVRTANNTYFGGEMIYLT